MTGAFTIFVVRKFPASAQMLCERNSTTRCFAVLLFCSVSAFRPLRPLQMRHSMGKRPIFVRGYRESLNSQWEWSHRAPICVCISVGSLRNCPPLNLWAFCHVSGKKARIWRVSMNEGTWLQGLDARHAHALTGGAPSLQPTKCIARGCRVWMPHTHMRLQELLPHFNQRNGLHVDVR